MNRIATERATPAAGPAGPQDLPAVDRLLRRPAVAALLGEHGRTLVAREARALLDALRSRALAGALDASEVAPDALDAATNQRLAEAVKAGRFRSDLYYRLNAYQIDIPPLRERKEDISPLARHFLDKYSAINGKKLRGFTDLAKRALLTYAWPGNVRELQNMVERGVILAPSGSRIEVQHLFPCSKERMHDEGLDMVGSLGGAPWEAGKALCDAALNGVMTLDQIEAMLLEAAVDKARGSLSSAARLLGLTRPQLAYRLKRLHEGAPGARADAPDGGGGGAPG